MLPVVSCEIQSYNSHAETLHTLDGGGVKTDIQESCLFESGVKVDQVKCTTSKGHQGRLNKQESSCVGKMPVSCCLFLFSVFFACL